MQKLMFKYSTADCLRFHSILHYIFVQYEANSITKKEILKILLVVVVIHLQNLYCTLKKTLCGK